MGRIAAELGTPLMGWQQLVADVALEHEDGRLVYREVIVSVPRQNGKTLLVLSAELARCLLWGREQRVAYTAQTGKDARTKVKDDHLPVIQRSPLNKLMRRAYLSDGNTAILWQNGSRISVLDNTPSAGHGRTLDLTVIDEAFADQDNAREQALLPTMATRENPQIWNVSTAGTPASTYLMRKVEVGRAAVRSGSTEGIAYFEWSVPEDEDVDEPGVIARHMPAYGVTIHDDFIDHARRTMTDGDFRRAVCNQWTESDERVIPAEWWTAVSAHEVRAAPVVYAVEASADRSWASVVRADGEGNLELVATRPGVAWLLEVIPAEITEYDRLVFDGYGPVSGIADDLEKQGFRIHRCDSLETRKACVRFFDAVADRKLRVRKDERLDKAVAAAVRKQSADQWTWNRDAWGGHLLMGMSLAFNLAVTDAPPFTPFVWD